MNLKTVLQKKFTNLFVAILFNETECVLRCKLIKNAMVQKAVTKTFLITYPLEAMDKAIEEYLMSLQDEYQFVYITYLLDTIGQGAIEGTGMESFQKYGVDMHSVHHIALNNQWTVYASDIEIKWVRNFFSDVGVDFIISPFMLLNDLLVSQKLKSKPTCYILNCNTFFILAVFQEKRLLFGAFFKTQNESLLMPGNNVNDWENEQKEEEIVSSDEFPELNDGASDDLEELTELGDVANIDDLRSTDSFSDVDDKTLGHFQGLENVKEEDVSLELYGRDLMVYKYLKSSLQEYYHNPLYTSEFIEEIVIFDGYEISSDLIHQLEDELMMDVEVHKVDVGESLCQLAMQEVFK